MKVWITCNGDGQVKALSSKALAKEFRTGQTFEDAPSNIGGKAGGFTYGGTPPSLLPPTPEGAKKIKTHGGECAGPILVLPPCPVLALTLHSPSHPDFPPRPL